MHSRIIDAAIRLVEGKQAAPTKSTETGEGYRIVRTSPRARRSPAPDVARRVDEPAASWKPASRPSPRRTPRIPARSATVDRSRRVAPQDPGLRPPPVPYGLPPLPSDDAVGLPGIPGGGQDVPQHAENGKSPRTTEVRPEDLVTLAKASFSFKTSYKRVLTDLTDPPGKGVPGVANKVRVYVKVPVSTRVVLRVRFDVPEDLDGLYEIRVRAPELGLEWQTILIPEEVTKGVVRFTFEDIVEGGPPSKIRYRHASLWPARLEWSVVPLNARYGG